MVNIDRIKRGVTSYVDAEMLPRVDGWKKWVFGAGVAMYMKQADALLNALRNYPPIKEMGIIAEDGEIDLETLHDAFREQAEKSGPTKMELPIIGTFTIGANDIDLLYRHIVSK